MAEYLTKYPKTISFFDGIKGMVNIEKSSNAYILRKEMEQDFIHEMNN